MDVTPSSSATSSQTAAKRSGMEMKSEDFINLMVTQLQNQDPLEPAKNEQLLSQMSQIGQLQASTQLQESLGKLVLQNNLGNAGGMIGKSIKGMDGNGAEVVGSVTSVRVQEGEVYLELDSGQTLSMSNVTEIVA